MKSERFKRTKSVMASGAIALVIAALAFGISSSVLGPKSAIAQHLGFDLTSGSSSFTITSSIYPSPACSGSTALLYPGTPRCMVFSVHNNLSVPISVGSITSALETTDYPAPPPACTGTNLTLPTYSGSFAVPANGDATSSGVPVELNDNGSNQDICETYTYHFTYTGSANYTDSTTTALTSTPNPSSSSQSVTFTATVTETNASTDPSGTTGTVTFYSCTSNTCASTTSLGTGSVGSNGQATLSTSSLPVGTDYIEAVYGGSGSNLTGSTSNVVTQTVTSGSLGTISVLTSSPNPSSYGTSVTFSDTVSASSGTPGGTVTFYSCTTNTCGTKTSLGTGTLASGKATYSTSSLPVGTTYVEAVYGASGNYGGSTSNVVTQVVLNVPSVCAAGSYGDVITGTPADPFLYGTNGNDFIYAFGASYWINGFGGNDCIDAGDGNNVVTEGDGNDGVNAGNGANAIVLGNGNDKVSLGNGSDGVWAGNGTDAVSMGNGSNDTVILGNGSDTVTVGNGSGGQVSVGNGNDTVTVGTGSNNHVNLGSGTDTVTIAGSHDNINGGNGNETVYLGSGTYNTYSGQAHHTNVCHLPKPPSSYHGTTAAYYHDTINNCTVVSP